MEEKSQILIGGDFMPGVLSEPFDPFSESVKTLFRSAAYTLVNLEAPLTERGKPILKTGKKFRVNPRYAEILKNSGVDCVCLANNHIRDYGDIGVLDTIRHCREAGLDIVGAGQDLADAAKPLVKEIGGMKVAFLNYCEREFSIAGENQAGANPFDLIDAYRDITKLRPVVDRIIVVYHGGLEYQHYPTLEMRRNFRFMVDIGADAVIAHHAHAYSGYEWYDNKPIFYGLGNLFAKTNARSPKENWFFGLLADFTIQYDDMECSFTLVSTQKDMNQLDMTNGSEYRRVMEKLNSISMDILGSGLREYWEDQYNRMSEKTINDFSAYTKNIARVRRILRVHKPRLGKYRTILWLNSFRCSSHREKMEAILKHRYLDINKYD